MSFNLPTSISGAKNTAPAWIRPSDWPATNEGAGEIIYLVADIGATSSIPYTITTTFNRTASQNLYIEWGDGTTDTITTNTATTTSHSYTPGSGTPCSRGYTTFVIRIYTDAGCAITQAVIAMNPFFPTVWNQSLSSTISYLTVPLLEVKFGSGVLTGLFSFLASSQRYTYVEYVKYPSTWLGTDLFRAFNYTCTSLERVDLPLSAPNLFDISNMAQDCYSLKGDIVIPPDAPITNAANAFSRTSISSLKWFPNNALCTGMGNICISCYNLIRVELGNLLGCESYSGAFSGCGNLQFFSLLAWVNKGPLSASVVLNLSSMFQTCSSLEYVNLPTFFNNNGTQINAQAMFSACGSLKSIVMPNYAAPGIVGTNGGYTNFNNMFQQCSSLQSVIFPNNVIPGSGPFVSSGSMNGMFSGCFQLVEVQLPANTSPGDCTSMFQNCYTIKSINLTGYNSLNNLNTAFSGCYSLSSLTLPSTLTSLTNLTGAFTNCWLLDTPIDLSTAPNITGMGTVFLNNYKLHTVIFPTNFNNCTSFTNMFANCASLTNVILPTSASSLTTINSAFSACSSIRSIVLPATTGLINTFNQTFEGCNSLETITFPNTQLTTLGTCQNMFNQCGMLKVVNNFNKLGGTLTTGTICSFSTLATNAPSITTGLTFSCRISQVAVVGTSATLLSKVPFLRFLNTGTGQWQGTSPQVNISFTSIGYTALVQLFNDIAATGTYTARTINITSCTGASSLTAADRLILTSRGWTITG